VHPLSFPNVSIGNPESFETPIEEWIPFFKGMTKSKGMTKDMDPRLHGDDRKGTGMTERARG